MWGHAEKKNKPWAWTDPSAVTAQSEQPATTSLHPSWEISECAHIPNYCRDPWAQCPGQAVQVALPQGTLVGHSAGDRSSLAFPSSFNPSRTPRCSNPKLLSGRAAPRAEPAQCHCWWVRITRGWERAPFVSQESQERLSFVPLPPKSQPELAAPL